jgi:branched-subunit amino acid transport protein
MVTHRGIAALMRAMAVQQSEHLQKESHMKLPSSKTRQYLYAVVAVLLSALVAYKVIAPEDVPLWLSIAGTVLGVVTSGTATVATKTQRASGVLPD